MRNESKKYAAQVPVEQAVVEDQSAEEEVGRATRTRAREENWNMDLG